MFCQLISADRHVFQNNLLVLQSVKKKFFSAVFQFQKKLVRVGLFSVDSEEKRYITNSLALLHVPFTLSLLFFMLFLVQIECIKDFPINQLFAFHGSNIKSVVES